MPRHVPVPVVELEGDYSDWTIYDRFEDADLPHYIGNQGGLFNRLETEILIFENLLAKRYTIATKTLTSLAGTDHDIPNFFTTPNWIRSYSVLGTYVVAIIYDENGIRIYKNGAVIKSFTAAELDIDSGEVLSVDISASGKYVIVSGYLTSEAAWGWVVLVGV